MSEDVWTIRRVLRWTSQYFTQKGIENPLLDAQLILCDALQISRLVLFTDMLRPLIAQELGAIRERVQRRAKGEPLAYIVGRQGFHDIELKVDARVLIPRPETELLVARALAHLEGREAPKIIDVGTGSGAVALAIAHAIAAERPDAQIIAVDLSEEALALARENQQALDLPQVRFVHSDLLSALDPAHDIDLIVSNPPYIPSADLAGLQVEVRAHEPRLALDGGADGLEVIRRLIDQAAAHLKPDGWLAFEIGYDQGQSAPDLLRAHGGYTEVALHRDLADLPRVVEGRRLAADP